METITQDEIVAQDNIVEELAVESTDDIVNDAEDNEVNDTEDANDTTMEVEATETVTETVESSDAVAPKKLKKKAVQASTKAGLIFPVGRTKRYMKEMRGANRIADNAAVYLAAVMEYFNAEVFEISGNQARKHKKVRIIPRHIRIAIGEDAELSTLLGNVIIPNGGVMPQLVPSKASLKKKKTSAKKATAKQMATL